MACTFLTASAATFDSEEELEQWLHSAYETNASQLCTKEVIAEWAYATDVDNEEVQKELVAVSLEAAEIKKKYWQKYFKDIVVDDITDEVVKREVAQLKVLGNSALESDKLETVKEAKSSKDVG